MQEKLSTCSIHNTPASRTRPHSVHDQCYHQDLLMYFVDEEPAFLKILGGAWDGDRQPAIGCGTQSEAL